MTSMAQYKYTGKKMIARSILGYTCILCVSLICFIPCFIISLLPEKYRFKNSVYYFFSDVFFKSVLQFSLLPIDIQGVEHIPRDQPLIFAGNHQSSLDIPLLGALCNKHPQVWLVLDYYAQYPILGFFVRRMNITVDQKKPRQSVNALHKAMNHARTYDSHIMIFPEGRRITTHVASFMKGFALLAQKMKRPVVPVYVKNNGHILPPNSVYIHDYPITCVVGKPFMYHDDESEQAFMERVHQWFKDQDDRMRNNRQ
jgi:1-acyl-sn-glycerol-3-phosphate acyltransferase